MKKYTQAVVVLLGLVVMVSAVQAQTNLPSGVPITLGEIGNIVSVLASFLIGISVVIAIIAIIWSGVTYMTAGADNTKVVLARQRLVSAIIGSLIVLGVGVILQTAAGIVNRSFFGGPVAPWWWPF